MSPTPIQSVPKPLSLQSRQPPSRVSPNPPPCVPKPGPWGPHAPKTPTMSPNPVQGVPKAHLWGPQPQEDPATPPTSPNDIDGDPNPPPQCPQPPSRVSPTPPQSPQTPVQAVPNPHLQGVPPTHTPGPQAPPPRSVPSYPRYLVELEALLGGGPVGAPPLAQHAQLGPVQQRPPAQRPPHPRRVEDEEGAAPRGGPMLRQRCGTPPVTSAPVTRQRGDGTARPPPPPGPPTGHRGHPQEDPPTQVRGSPPCGTPPRDIGTCRAGAG